MSCPLLIITFTDKSADDYFKDQNNKDMYWISIYINCYVINIQINQ